MTGGLTGMMLSLPREQRMAMAWWVFFGQCECINCCRLRHAWHAARIQGAQADEQRNAEQKP